MDEQRISIITVVYNDIENIEKTILSVLNQDYKNFEYIIIDGNSTDGTVDIIRKYENKLSFFISEPDGGIYDAMNKGLKHSSGDWIIFMNSGDLFNTNDVLSVFFNKVSYKNNIGIVYGYPLNKAGNKIRSHSLTKVNLFFERTICHQAIFAKKETFINNLFDINYPVVADRKWLFCALKKYDSFFLDYPVCIYDESGFSSDINRYHNDSRKLQIELFGVLGMLEQLKYYLYLIMYKRKK